MKIGKNLDESGIERKSPRSLFDSLLSFSDDQSDSDSNDQITANDEEQINRLNKLKNSLHVTENGVGLCGWRNDSNDDNNDDADQHENKSENVNENVESDLELFVCVKESEEIGTNDCSFTPVGI